MSNPWTNLECGMNVLGTLAHRDVTQSVLRPSQRLSAVIRPDHRFGHLLNRSDSRERMRLGIGGGSHPLLCRNRRRNGTHSGQLFFDGLREAGMQDLLSRGVCQVRKYYRKVYPRALILRRSRYERSSVSK